MITPAILEPASLVALAVCLLIAAMLPKQSLYALHWWYSFFHQAFVPLWRRMRSWRITPGAWREWRARLQNWLDEPVEK